MLLVVIGLGGAGAGAVLLQRELTRAPTHAELSAAVASAIGSRWRQLSAGQIFPEVISYSSAALPLQAHRVGIAPAASCAAALDPAVVTDLRQAGCVTVLRATYVDPSGTYAATVAVVVLRSRRAATAAAGLIGAAATRSGVRAVGFPGTFAAAFADSQRSAFSAQAGSAGPYLFMFAAGSATGQPATAGGSQGSQTDLGLGVLGRVGPACSPATAGHARCGTSDADQAGAAPRGSSGACRADAGGGAGTCLAATASAAAHGGGQGSPADGRAALLREMRAAWQITNGHGVTVAVLSSGVTQVHDLAGKVITGPDFAPGRRASKTEGTVLASAIAGSGPTTASPFGAIGRAPGARILAITVIGTGKANAAGTWQLDLASGIRYAAGHGAKVIAVDYTGYPSNVTLDSAVAYAVSRGAVIVTAGYGLPKHRNGLQVSQRAARRDQHQLHHPARAARPAPA